MTKLKAMVVILAVGIICAGLWTCIMDVGGGGGPAPGATNAATSRRSTSSAPATTRLTGAPYPINFATTTFEIKGKMFRIEIADTDEKDARGLMYRESMDADHGMLFIFPQPGITNFWMKNTLIPLDIIFLDKDRRVMEIFNAKPRDETGLGPKAESMYVIELNAGRSKELGLKPGDVVAIPEKYLKRATAGTEK